ncbi:hypothetical protein ACYFX5_13475 [Bremerella sp. T1]|uniref:hypothetical protein n=1 Tax=Bremerella sp. TYQ1 TaxID=3119568 RepID=UPI001CC97CB0|nr:hypothetical protein [Bremerella volcania]UBM34069.1 hypothetical protein LA756_15415 [Bremerella volcania]
MSSRRFSLVNLLLLQASLAVAFFLSPYIGWTGVGLLCFVGAGMAFFDVLSSMDQRDGKEVDPLPGHLAYRMVSGLIGAAFGALFGFGVMVAVTLASGTLSLQWLTHVVSASCLVGAAICASFVTVGRRLSKCTGAIYAIVMMLGN